MKLDRADKLNVVPLIDVMLVLLVIVLTAASFISYGKIEVSLPKQGSSDKDFPKERTEISLFADGSIKFNDILIDQSELKDRLSSLDKKEFILFKGDEEAAFGSFVSILRVLKDLQMSNFLIMTQEKK